MAFWTLLQRDLRALYGQWPTLVIFYVGLPLLLTYFILTGLSEIGADRVVPGFAFLFAFASATTLAARITAERAGGLWRVLTVAPIPFGLPLLSNVLAVWLLTVLQGTAVLAFGWLALGLSRGPTLLVTLGFFEAVAVGLGLLAASFIPDPAHQAQVINPVQGLIFGGAMLGGAVVPLAGFPVWLQVVGRLTPHYWAMENDAGGWLVLAAMAAVLGGAGLRRFAARGMA